MRYGPTFADELTAAGLGNGLAWTADTILGRDSLSPEDQAKLDAVVTAHDPSRLPAPPREPMTPLQFMELLTPEERKAIRRLAKTNEDVEDWLGLLTAASSVRLDDPRTTQGMAIMVYLGALTKERAQDLLSKL